MDAGPYFRFDWMVSMRQLKSTYFSWSRAIMVAVLFQPATVLATASDSCPGDLNGDAKIDGADLSQLLSGWGPCGHSSPCTADLDDDGLVGGSDLALLLAGWGECPPMVSDPGWTDLPSLLAEDSRIIYLATNEVDTELASRLVPAWRIFGAQTDATTVDLGDDAVLFPGASDVLEPFGLGHLTGTGLLEANLSQVDAAAILDSLGVELAPATVTFFGWRATNSSEAVFAVALHAEGAPITLSLSGSGWMAEGASLLITHAVPASDGSSLIGVRTVAAGETFLQLVRGIEFANESTTAYLYFPYNQVDVVYLDYDGESFQTKGHAANANRVNLSTAAYDLVGLPILNQHGRGYYLPSDPEIGPDPTNPVGPIVAHKEPLGALRALGANRAEAPDWVLFKRGDEFDASLIDSSIPYGGDAWNLGAMFRLGYANPVQGFHESAGFRRGLSPEAPFVIAAWGDESLPRPRIRGGFSKPVSLTDSVIASLDFSGRGSSFDLLGAGSASQAHADSLIEDCVLAAGHPGMIGFGGPLTIRRSVISGAWNGGSHVQGMYVHQTGFYESLTDLVFEECILDHNGFKEDPFDPSKWTASAVSGLSPGQLPMGTGVQPTRTFFDRNLYVSTGNGVDHARVALRGCIISRGAGGGSVQMRQGGLSERNVFLWNEDVGSMSCGPGGIFRSNLVLHDDHMRPPGGWGMGLKVYNSETWNNEGSGWSLDPNPQYIVDDSIFAHFHRGSNGGGLLDVYNASTRHYANGSNYGTLLNGRVTITNNAFHRSQAEALKFHSFGTWDDATIGGNQIAVPAGTLFNSAPIHLTSVAEKGSVPYSIGDAHAGGNLYWSQSATPFGGNRTFAQWQALRSGFESESQFLSDFAAFKAAAGWTAPERDIVSYMQSVDPTFIPDEDVTTDDGVPADRRRPDARLVREVLRDPAVGGYTAPFWGDSEGMTEARARLVARRYHAFITFIERAKANRKGAWDPAYTADALNNYIREGFGKTPVGGPYTATYPGEQP